MTKEPGPILKIIDRFSIVRSAWEIRIALALQHCKLCVYSRFYISVLRTEILEEYAIFCEETNPKKLLRPCQTRWLSLLAVVERTVDRLPTLKSYFQSENLDASAKTILATLENPLTELYLLFLKDALPTFTRFNLKFQVCYSIEIFIYIHM